MSTPTTLSLKKIYSGKVRDLYEIDDKRMLMVATDRLSAFDVILDEPIPEKGKILTALSLFWFEKFRHQFEHHLLSAKVKDYPKELAKYQVQLQGRASPEVAAAFLRQQGLK